MAKKKRNKKQEIQQNEAENPMVDHVIFTTKVMHLSIGDLVSTGRRKTARVTHKSPCSGRWRNHFHITLSNGASGCYWEHAPIDVPR